MDDCHLTHHMACMSFHNGFAASLTWFAVTEGIVDDRCKRLGFGPHLIVVMIQVLQEGFSSEEVLTTQDTMFSQILDQIGVLDQSKPSSGLCMFTKNWSISWRYLFRQIRIKQRAAAAHNVPFEASPVIELVLAVAALWSTVLRITSRHKRLGITSDLMGNHKMPI